MVDGVAVTPFFIDNFSPLWQANSRNITHCSRKKKNMRKSSRGNPYHDERGRFCSGPKGNCKYTVSEKTPEEYDEQTKRRFSYHFQNTDDGCSVKTPNGDTYKCKSYEDAVKFAEADRAINFAQCAEETGAKIKQPITLTEDSRGQVWVDGEGDCWIGSTNNKSYAISKDIDWRTERTVYGVSGYKYYEYRKASIYNRITGVHFNGEIEPDADADTYAKVLGQLHYWAAGEEGPHINGGVYKGQGFHLLITDKDGNILDTMSGGELSAISDEDYAKATGLKDFQIFRREIHTGCLFDNNADKKVLQNIISQLDGYRPEFISEDGWRKPSINDAIYRI